MLPELSVEIKLSSYLKKEREMCLTSNFLEKQVALLFDRQFLHLIFALQQVAI